MYYPTRIAKLGSYTGEDIKEAFGVTEPFEYIFKPVEAIDMKNAIESVLQKKNET